MKIVSIHAAQKERKVTVKTTKGNLILQQFGKDIVTLDNCPAGLKKSDNLYLSLKKICAVSEYFNDNTTKTRTYSHCEEIKTHLKPFIGRELKEI